MLRLLFVILLTASGISCLPQANTPSSQSLFSAVKNNDLKELKILLDRGADPNAYDDDSDHVLMYAALYSSPDCMQLLLEKGSNANARNKLDETALMWAVHDADKIKLLLKHGADINAKAGSGNTALLIASVG